MPARRSVGRVRTANGEDSTEERTIGARWGGSLGVADTAVASGVRVPTGSGSPQSSDAAQRKSCECGAGCPSCVQTPNCGNGNDPLHEAGAADVLKVCSHAAG